MTSFFYLATPYSKYHAGIEQAFRDACREAWLLIKAGVPVFSPIAHTHPIAMSCGVDPLDHSIWLPADQAMMDAASGIIVCKMDGWEHSFGIAEELKVFKAANKPVIYMVPGVLPEVFEKE